jgi:ubiquinol-cytochrome c reductase cytochrome b subunit
MKYVKQILAWLEHRLELRDSLGQLMRHPVPAALTGRVGWWYVFGSVTMTLLMLQVVTGICLATVYEPTAAGAYASLEYLNYEAPFGWLLRAIHYWSASGMVVMLIVHMTQVFLMGAFKYPRELTWLVGVGLLVLTLALAFTGQVLRFDGDSYWGVGVGASATGRVPAAGPSLVHLILGGEYIGGETLTRFFALHVFVLPLLLAVLLAVHLYLVVKRGISEPPQAGQPVDPATYDRQYAELLRRGVPFFPHALYRDGVACAISVMVVVGLSVTFGPKGPGEIADPTLINAEPRPDWYFLPLFALAALAPPSLETVLMLGLPVVGILALAAVPLVAGRGERSVRLRPVAVLVVLITFVSLTILGWYGHTAPWSPQMDAWSGEPVPPAIVKRLTPLELQGAIAFQNKACRNCHALEGSGGRRGPDLTDVGRRLNSDVLVRQVVQGGGNMPAYGQQLDSAEVGALVAFLVKLRPEGLPPARMPAAPAIKDQQP